MVSVVLSCFEVVSVVRVPHEVVAMVLQDAADIIGCFATLTVMNSCCWTAAGGVTLHRYCLANHS